MQATRQRAAVLSTAMRRATIQAGLGLLALAGGGVYASDQLPVERRLSEQRRSALDAAVKVPGRQRRPEITDTPEFLRNLEKRRRSFARIDALVERGKSTKIPAPSDSLLGDAGGVRSYLADHGIGISAMSLNSLSYDLLAHPDTHPQRFGGQRPTVNDTQQINVTYDLARIGIDHAQFIFGLVNRVATWNPGGPRTRISLSRFAYYQSFDDRRWELVVGYNCNDLEYYGAFVGGSMSSGVFGPSATIPYEVGLSRLPLSAPGFNLTYNADHHIYNKFGLQRSLDSRGGESEHDRNPYGVRFASHGGGLLMIDELGYRRHADAEATAVWVRGGVIYNTADFQKPETPRSSRNNYASYLLVDIQLARLDPHLPFRGWYLGFSANDARHDVNIYAQSAELRLYGVGVFNNRPFDMISLIYSYTGFSQSIRRSFQRQGIDPVVNSQSLTGNYVARLMPGMYVNAGLGYTNRPTFAPRSKNSLNLNLGVNFFF